MSSTAYHVVEKFFRDYADDIEGVNIHYVVTRIGEAPNWEAWRSTRYMPIVKGATRKKALRLPKLLFDPETGAGMAHYLLHYYFEIFQGGDRHYSQLYTEEVVTDDDDAYIHTPRDDTLKTI